MVTETIRSSVETVAKKIGDTFFKHDVYRVYPMIHLRDVKELDPAEDREWPVRIDINEELHFTGDWGVKTEYVEQIDIFRLGSKDFRVLYTGDDRQVIEYVEYSSEELEKRVP